jgi:hypothetical protein
MNTVSDLEWSAGSKNVVWRCNGLPVCKAYNEAPGSVCELEDGSGVLVIEPLSMSAPRNAVIFEATGSERVRIEALRVTGGLVGYYEGYYSGGGLMLVFESTAGLWWAHVDERTGQPSAVNEYR